MRVKQAFILAAGYGTRLRPLTLHTPKPLVSVGGRPLLDYHLMHLRKHGIEEVFINTFYLSEQIIDYVQKQSFGLKVTVSREEGEILGTAGGVMKQIQHLDDEFLVVYGDNLTNVNYSDYFSFLENKEYDASIVLYHENNITQKGMAIVNDTGYISGFIEKPEPEQVVSDLANAGIYVLKKSVFQQYTPGTGSSDFGFDFFPKLLANQKKILAYTTNDLVLDIGSFENLEKANILLGSKTASFE